MGWHGPTLREYYEAWQPKQPGEPGWMRIGADGVCFAWTEPSTIILGHRWYAQHGDDCSAGGCDTEDGAREAADRWLREAGRR